MPSAPDLSAGSAESPLAAPVSQGPSPPEATGLFRLSRFLAVFFVWDLAWWAVVGAFAAPALPGGWLAIAALAVLAALPLVVLVRMVRGTLYPSAALRVGVMRPFWYAQLGLPLLGVASLAGGLAGAPFGAAGAAGRWALVALLAAYGTVTVTGYFGSRALVVRRFEATFEDLPPDLEGVRIAQLSDLHVGPHTSRTHLSRIAAAVREARPDLLAFTGDQVDDHDLDVAHFARAFGDLRAPLGVFAVPGNHDVYAGWDGVEKGMAAMGAKVLVNDAVAVPRGGATLWVAGTGDPAGLQWGAEGGVRAAPDVARTMSRVPEGAFSVVLAHNPALWPALAERGARLTLSGHTHHGQISIPALRWCLASPFLKLSMGSYRLGGSLLYVSPGTNYWGLPLRLGAWPEVTVVTLRQGPTGMRRVG